MKWHYNKYPIEAVEKFNYLGVLFNYNDKCTVAIKQRIEQSNKTIFGLERSSKNMCLNVETEVYLFNSYILQVLSYGMKYGPLQIFSILRNYILDTANGFWGKQ